MCLSIFPESDLNAPQAPFIHDNFGQGMTSIKGMGQKIRQRFDRFSFPKCLLRPSPTPLLRLATTTTRHAGRRGHVTLSTTTQSLIPSPALHPFLTFQNFLLAVTRIDTEIPSPPKSSSSSVVAITIPGHNMCQR